MSARCCSVCGIAVITRQWDGLCARCQATWEGRSAHPAGRKRVSAVELWVAIRNALGAEYGRQYGNASAPVLADHLDLDGLTNAIDLAIQPLLKGAIQ